MKYKDFKNRRSVALYLDMDGVFCGFEEKIVEIFPEFWQMDGKFHDEFNGNQFYKELNTRMVQTIISEENFWNVLPWAPGGQELFKWIKKNQRKFTSVSILTAPILRDKKCIPQKQEWVHNNFSGLVLDAFYADKEKWKYVNRQPGEVQILIDDRKKNIDAWVNNSGEGFIHSPSNWKNTISYLQNSLNIL